MLKVVIFDEFLISQKGDVDQVGRLSRPARISATSMVRLDGSRNASVAIESGLLPVLWTLR